MHYEFIVVAIIKINRRTFNLFCNCVLHKRNQWCETYLATLNTIQILVLASDYIINLCRFRFFWDTLYSVNDITSRHNVIQCSTNQSVLFCILISAPPCNTFTASHSQKKGGRSVPILLLKSSPVQSSPVRVLQNAVLKYHIVEQCCGFFLLFSMTNKLALLKYQSHFRGLNEYLWQKIRLIRSEKTQLKRATKSLQIITTKFE